MKNARAPLLRCAKSCSAPMRMFRAKVKRFNDLTGKKFGYLRVIAYAGTDRHRRRQWRVLCERCGYTVKIVLAANLLSGRSTTCGCISRFKAHERMKAFALAEKLGAMEAKGMSFDGVKTILGL